MKLPIRDGFYLTEYKEGDQAALIEYLADKDIYNTTGGIPYPYTEKEANHWIHARVEENKSQPVPTNYAIRREDGYLIGGAGFIQAIEPGDYKAEIGYWIAKPYWGQGLATDTVTRLRELGFNQFGLVRIFATVFSGNPASGRVLEKCGFQHEGTLRKNFLKDGGYLDVKIYGLVH